ncbi:Transposase-like protein, partial [mine drainage metagenome]
MDPDELQLHTKIIGPLPVINHFMHRLHLDEILMRRIPGESSHGVSAVECIGTLVRNILVSREPLYGMGEWVEEFPAELLGILAGNIGRINDDRIDRSLERLFYADRSSLM